MQVNPGEANRKELTKYSSGAFRKKTNHNVARDVTMPLLTYLHVEEKHEKFRSLILGFFIL